MNKGRSKELIALRDDTLVRRYYHWTEQERLRFDDVFKVLEFEFYISEDRIKTIVRKNTDLIKKLGRNPVFKVKKTKITGELLDILSKNKVSRKGVKGRNKELIALRDEILLHRFYYLTEIERIRTDYALSVLSRQEFFISEERIMRIVSKNIQRIAEFRLEPAPKSKTGELLDFLYGKQ